jgi:hypothetical protein
LLSNMPPQTYFRKKPASTNTISKKANLKNRGPAVIAAGVGNPPAPGLCARAPWACSGRKDRNGRYLPLDSPRARRRPTHRQEVFYLNRPKTPPRRLQDGPRRLQDGPRSPKTAQDVPKRPPRCPKMPPRRPQDPPRAAQERPRAPQDAPGPLKWSHVGAHVGTKIQFRRYLMLKQPEG